MQLHWTYNSGPDGADMSNAIIKRESCPDIKDIFIKKREETPDVKYVLGEIIQERPVGLSTIYLGDTNGFILRPDMDVVIADGHKFGTYTGPGNCPWLDTLPSKNYSLSLSGPPVDKFSANPFWGPRDPRWDPIIMDRTNNPNYMAKFDRAFVSFVNYRLNVNPGYDPVPR